ncbi:MAG: metal ABC transporter substrate-binding protein [Robiginitalea sp.]|nr:metal ABC transporter substrate-binding protein [Robiginitalea sp.]
MKRLLLLAVLTAFALTGCKQTQKQEAEANPPEEAATKPVVYVSNYPLYYFTSRIGGDLVELHFPAAALIDPSGWTPPADTVALMQQADLILVNGASYEGWLMNVSLPDSLLSDTSAAFADRLLPSGETFTHSHGEEGEHAHEGTASTTWMDLSLAGQQAKAVRDALTRARPALQEEFEANYRVLASELSELDKAFKETAAASAEAHLVFSHPVYQYFQKAYGLEGQSLHWEPDAPLDHDMLHEIGHLKKDHDIQYLIWEATPLPESVQQLQERGIQSAVIELMGGRPESADFLEGMRQNLETLQRVLGIKPEL